MKTICKLKIKDVDWDVILANPNEVSDEDFSKEDLGSTVYQKSKIYINKNISESMIIRTITHEITHALIWTYGLYTVKWDEELVCQFIETHARDILEYSEEVILKWKEIK